MQNVNGLLHLSASDLVGHLNCHHLTVLDLAVANGTREKPVVWDPLLQILSVRARELAAECRKQLAAGLDPIEHRRRLRVEKAGVPTFGEFADQYVDDMTPQWVNAKHIAQVFL